MHKIIIVVYIIMLIIIIYNIIYNNIIITLFCCIILLHYQVDRGWGENANQGREGRLFNTTFLEQTFHRKYGAGKENWCEDLELSKIEKKNLFQFDRLPY